MRKPQLNPERLPRICRTSSNGSASAARSGAPYIERREALIHAGISSLNVREEPSVHR
jgi:hypothetical protein